MYLDYNGTDIIVTRYAPNQIGRVTPPELRERLLAPWVPAPRDLWLRAVALSETNMKLCPVCGHNFVRADKGVHLVSEAFMTKFGISKLSIYYQSSIAAGTVLCGGNHDSWGIIRIMNSKVSPKTLYFVSKEWKV